MNTKTEWGGWAKAVLMQEGDLPTVADCCRVAALLETDVQQKIAALEWIAREAQRGGSDVDLGRIATHACKALGVDWVDGYNPEEGP